jgi:hypothetical protein
MLWNLIAAALATPLCGHVTDTGAIASAHDRPSARVRSTDRRIAYALRRGAEASPTFRRLLRELEESTVIVYVEAGRCQHLQPAGCLALVAASGGQRFLRVLVNPQQPTDRLVAMIAHELQHAREVSEAPEVVDDATVAALFRRIGRQRDGMLDVYETPAAIRIGELVAKELKSRQPVQ